VCYENNYPEHLKKAYSFWEQHNAAFVRAAIRCGELPEVLFAIVAPELGAYNLWTDMAETRFVSRLYVDLGSGYANFSIGVFQMKPSFAESVEKWIHKYEVLEGQSFFTTRNGEESASKRATRVQALTETNGQLEYLAAMVSVLQHRFPEIRELPICERIRFFAAAYNRGFDCSRAEIERFYTLHTFPARHFGVQFAYADVAVYFFNACFVR
jgi:hypothetical protein